MNLRLLASFLKSCFHMILVLSIFPACLADETDTNGNKPTIKIATYNIRGPKDKYPNDWDSRFPRMLKTIQENKFEIFGVQEGMKEAMNDLANALNYTYFGMGRDKNKSGEHCCIFYDPAKFDVLKKETFWLSDTPNSPGSKSWDSGCERICTWGIFKDLRTQEQFVVANTHLDNASPMARVQGVSLILKKLALIIEKYPFILTGDFNSDFNGQPLKILLSHLNDTRQISETDHYGAGDETFHAFEVNRSKRTNRTPIDYIFVNNHVRVLSHGTINDFRDGLASSDHFPVTAEIELQPLKAKK